MSLFQKFKFAQNPDIRRRALFSYDSRLAVNAPLLDKMLELRRKISKMLGYESWADYITEERMIKNAKNAENVCRLLHHVLYLTHMTP